MSVAVVAPWLPGCPHREAAWRWTRARLEETFPAWPVVTGSSDPFSRSQAILDGARRTDADVLVVIDSDVWCDGIAAAVDQVAAGHTAWAVPHLLLHRLSPESTELVLAGADWLGLPLSTDNAQDRRPYRGHETGTLVVIRRDVLLDVPPDPRHVSWGFEDDDWALALRCLVGPPWCGAADVVHLWHPPQPRLSRRVGSEAGAALHRRYKAARANPTAMRALIDEAKPTNLRGTTAVGP